jgi:hypothetical protein
MTCEGDVKFCERPDAENWVNLRRRTKVSRDSWNLYLPTQGSPFYLYFLPDHTKTIPLNKIEFAFTTDHKAILH